MSIMRCPDCQKNIDTDFDSEHFPCVDKEDYKRIELHRPIGDVFIETGKEGFIKKGLKAIGKSKTKSRLMGYAITFSSSMDFREVERHLDDFLREVTDRNAIEFVREMLDSEIEKERKGFLTN